MIEAWLLETQRLEQAMIRACRSTIPVNGFLAIDSPRSVVDDTAAALEQSVFPIVVLEKDVHTDFLAIAHLANACAVLEVMDLYPNLECSIGMAYSYSNRCEFYSVASDRLSEVNLFSG